MVGEERPRWGFADVAAVAAVAVGYAVAVVLQDRSRPWWQWLLVRTRRELAERARSAEAARLAIDAEARLRLALGDVVTPIADVLGLIGGAGTDEERSGLTGRLGQLVVDSTVNLASAERARAVFFEIDGVMLPGPWSGRSEAPVTAFADDPADERGTEAFKLVRDRTFLAVDDLDAEVLPVGVRKRPGAPYRSFIGVAVYADAWDFGMLTVDATEPGAFDDSDVDVARALAHLLGAGLAVG